MVSDTDNGWCSSRCQIFLEADRLWQEFLLHAEHFLSVPQFVTVVCAMAEVAAGLESVWTGQDHSQFLTLASLTQAVAASQV